MRKIAFVSDLHVFSRYAIFPPFFVTEQGMKIECSEAQAEIYDHWLEFCDICNRENVDTVVMNGDCIHGQNPIERGNLLVSPNLNEQIDVGTQILKLLVFGKDYKRKLLMFSGSGYHKSTPANDPEKGICDKLDGIWMGAIANIKFAPSNRVFNIQHGESAAYIYREMLLGRELLFLKYAEALGKIPHIDIKIQGHWHNFIHIHEHKLHMVQLPCWMAFEPSRIYLKSYGKMQSDIGGVIISLDEVDRIHVWHYLWNPPHIADEVQVL